MFCLQYINFFVQSHATYNVNYFIKFIFFIRPLIVGGDEFKSTYLHFSPFCIMCGHSLILP